jgi:hypothetical protein
MPDIKTKLARGIGNNPRGELGTVPAFRTDANPYTHRITIDIDDASYRALKLASLREGNSMADIVRAFLHTLPEFGQT